MYYGSSFVGFQPYNMLDNVDFLLQMRKAVVEEYPILAWKETVLKTVHQTVRDGIINGGDSIRNYVYNEDIPILSDFVGGLFNATDGDFSGTLRDLQGNPVPNGKGGYFDHLGSDVDRRLLQEELDKVNSYITEIEKMFERFGGIN